MRAVEPVAAAAAPAKSEAAPPAGGQRLRRAACGGDREALRVAGRALGRDEDDFAPISGGEE